MESDSTNSVESEVHPAPAFSLPAGELETMPLNTATAQRNGSATSTPFLQARELMRSVNAYLRPVDMGLVESALEFATECHDGQLRESGEPYIIHPIAVAAELAKLKSPADVIAAGLLHDTVEDCDVTAQEVADRFGEPVAQMVDGVTKLAQIDTVLDMRGSERRNPNDPELRNIATMRKMIVFAVNNLQVLQIKLADKMHNTSTLEHVADVDKRLQKGQEALDIYAPLADRLGMNDIKWRMEDEAFRVLKPDDYRATSRLVSRKRKEREQYASLATRILKHEVVAQAGIRAEISGRAKHLYSIHQKKQKYESEGKNFNEIHDLIALRVITESEEDCYKALGVVHRLWKMKGGEFDDYISAPKDNGYKSIHTTVHGPDNRPLEVQIRSREMHEVAEVGVAAHHAYKDGAPGKRSDDTYRRIMSALRALIEAESATDDLGEFFNTFKEVIDQSDRVRVFTPFGDIIELPAKATALDFAYKVHTEVGHRAAGAVVDGRVASLNTQLHTGNTVKIITSKIPKGPNIDWMDETSGYIRTAHARSKAGQYFRRQSRETNLKDGKQQLEKLLQRIQWQGHVVTEDAVADILGYSSVEDLMMDLGRSDIKMSTALDRAATALNESAGASGNGWGKDAGHAMTELEQRNGRSGPGIVVDGQTGLKVNVPKCCSPEYGDEIIGYHTLERGVTAHQTSCSKVINSKHPERLINVAWGHRGTMLPVRVRVEGWDRIGFTHDITGILKDAKMNMHDIRSGENQRPGKSELAFTVYLTDTSELGTLFTEIENVMGVESVERVE